MFAEFCLRMSLGAVAWLPLLPARDMHPKFFRTQFLIALGLSVVAALSNWSAFDWAAQGRLGVAIAFTFVAAICWSLDPSPLGRFWIFAASLSLAMVLLRINLNDTTHGGNAICSGLFLGAALTAMMVGHSYLISPGLSIQPLFAMLIALACMLAARIAIVALAICIVDAPSNEYWLWLIPRLLIGLAGPLVFGWMAFITARIRSTQSATGILYVVVVCAILGELMGMLIERTTGVPA